MIENFMQINRGVRKKEKKRKTRGERDERKK